VIAVLAGIAGLGVAIWALVKLRTVVDVACGYKSKVLCTAIFASGRRLDPQYADEIAADSYWILRPFRARVDASSAAVTTSLAGLRPRTAVYREGFGATLLDRRADPERIGLHERGRTSGRATLSRSACPVPLRAAIRPEVQAVVDRAFQEPTPSRLRRTHAVVVVQDGQIVAERYARDVGAETPLPGWSMAKGVLSALVGILVQEGRLSLDTHELLPLWRPPDPRAAISLEDLLRMRSGLRFAEVYSNPWSDVVKMLFTLPDAATYAASRPLSATPGSVWSYSSGTTNILSAIVRQAVGESEYASWPRRALFDRLGMPSAVVEPDASGTFVFSSFMLATARDWARYGQMWVDGGRCGDGAILSQEWIRFSTTPTPQSADGAYGAHWWLKLNAEIGGGTPAAASIAGDAFFAIGHEGQTLTVIPSRRLVIVRLGTAIYIDAWNQAEFVASIQEAI
jgi:CubicO group peptidase (beta-lactamase class C family)